MDVKRNAEGITATVEGMDQLKATLLALPDKIRRKVLLSALRKGAAVVRKAARAATPELAKPTPYRTKGLLKKRLMVRVSRTSKAAGHVGVFVNIRPAEGTQRGARSPNDPFYWRFVNFGTKKKGNKLPAAKFLEAGAAVLPQALKIFEREIGPAIQKFDTP